MKAPEGKESDADRGRIRELEQQIQDLTDKREERLDEVKGIAADLEDRAPTLKVRRTLPAVTRLAVGLTPPPKQPR